MQSYKPTCWFSVKEDGQENERRRFDGESVDKELFKILKKTEEIIYNSFGSGQSIAYVEIDVKKTK